MKNGILWIDTHRKGFNVLFDENSIRGDTITLYNANVLEPGQLVIVRRRPAIVRHCTRTTAKDPSDVLNIVDIDYIDGWDFPPDDRIIWEREIGAEIKSSIALPKIDEPSVKPDDPQRYRAFLNAIIWTSQGGILGDTHDLLSPWQSAVQVEDYQLYPVLKALTMPRVSLLLADDVGLGKTIEAGLISSELISKRRIRRLLILCPASLQVQWKEEMKEKFNLDFEIMDSSSAFEIQKKFGMDTNPWRMTPRIITSMDYLKQPDVLERFLSAFEESYTHGLAALPWDLLIVDEAHHFMPSSRHDESLRCKMLRDITKYFEHRLFLTATPHNGYTVAFSGLLELLDPVRFQQKVELDDNDRAQIQLAMIRRMKSELNARTAQQRFPEREVDAIPLNQLSEEEITLFTALREYRTSGLKIVSKGSKNEVNLGRFLFSLLTKRLLSSTYAFAQTWWNHVGGFDLDEFGFDEADASFRKATGTIANDEEKKRLEDDTTRYGGGWLRKYGPLLQDHLHAVSSALEALGWDREAIENADSIEDLSTPDAKWDALLSWVRDKLMEGDRFRDDERLIIFTEYKDTLEYLSKRLEEIGFTTPVVRCLYGGMDEASRSLVKSEFNDPGSALRILLATDVASEGLNLQMSCRYVIHQEIPWNPARLEQRNGRVDRHGQARDVFVHHFVSDQDEDMNFLDFVARKANRVREDLGSAGVILDEAVLQHFDGHVVTEEELDKRLDLDKDRSQEKQDTSKRDAGREDAYRDAIQHLRATERKLGLTPDNLAGLLDQAVITDGGKLEETEDEGVFKFSKVPAVWRSLVESSLCIQTGEDRGAMPHLTFDPAGLEEVEYGRKVFRPRPSLALVRLGHPLMKRSLAVFRRRLWDDSVTHPMRRWTIYTSRLPGDIDLVACIHCILSVRNELGEVLHSQVVDVPLQLARGGAAAISRDLWEQVKLDEARPLEEGFDEKLKLVREIWTLCQNDIEERVEHMRKETEKDFTERLGVLLEEARKAEDEAFSKRLDELEKEKDPKNLIRIRDELRKAEELAIQRTFYDYINREHRQRRDELKEELKQVEWERQHTQVVLLKNRLVAERQRILEKVIPSRYSLATVDIWPAAVTIIMEGA